MFNAQYPDYARHSKDHEEFTGKIREFKKAAKTARATWFLRGSFFPATGFAITPDTWTRGKVIIYSRKTSNVNEFPR
jgi:hypothetical protein